ncbi:hypothetical protein MX629_06015 [Carnobacterium divergens]|uniref:Uncharacterized protein n=1 Tax=Carnobacterium divergens TaxID=2748 RepID=A0AAW8R8H8_CARDV|nr:hypothetical protein [Carnobacterium divergens]MDT1957977.1 hypothetical protein [Carnobacterium divergens]MDT1973980.1 hypothetical protein [Carnobacterium divergens]
MNLLIFLFIIIVLSFLVKWSNTKNDFSTAVRLRKEFNEWILPDTYNKRPSNAEFTNLYEKCYGTKTNTQPVYEGNRAVIITKNIDVIASFPTTHNQLLMHEFGILDNLVDHYELKYKETFKLNYWINFIIFLPQQFVSYIGLSEKAGLSKILNIVYWVLSGLFLFIKPILQKLILHFFE